MPGVTPKIKRENEREGKRGRKRVLLPSSTPCRLFVGPLPPGALLLFLEQLPQVTVPMPRTETRVAVAPPSSTTPGAAIGIATQQVLDPRVLRNSADARRAHWEAGRCQAGVSRSVSPPGSPNLRVLSPSAVPDEAGLSPWRGLRCAGAWL